MLDISRRQKYSNTGSTINKSQKYIDLNFDLESLNLMCTYVISENAAIRRSHLLNMRNLFAILNPDLYMSDRDKMSRYQFIIKGLEARLVANISGSFLIIKYVNGGLLDNNLIDPDNLKYLLSTSEVEWIHHTISKSLTHSYLYYGISTMRSLVSRFDAADPSTRHELDNEYVEFIMGASHSIRHSRVEDRSEAMFSLRDNFDDNMRDIHADLSSPSSILYTGIQGFNEITGGGFHSARAYMLFGLPAAGKSITLLDFAVQIKRHNKGIKTKDPTKIPCVVLLTQENTVKESVERLFNLTVMGDNIRNYSADEVIRLLKQDGELYLSDGSPIDIIIKFKPSGSIDTSYLYTLTEDLEEDGYECICMFHDYIKHIRPINKKGDLRLDLGEIVNEYKVFASIKDIPLIGVSQLNRDAAKNIDAAAENNKADMTRLLGRSNIGESMIMLENLDWACIINRDYDQYGNMYMVFKRIKIRYAATERDYICQPFVNGSKIRLIEDIHLPVPLFKETLKAGAAESNLYNGTVTAKKIITNTVRRDISELISDQRKHIEDTNVFDKKFQSMASFSEFDDNYNTQQYIQPQHQMIEMYCPFSIA